MRTRVLHWYGKGARGVCPSYGTSIHRSLVYTPYPGKVERKGTLAIGDVLSCGPPLAGRPTGAWQKNNAWMLCEGRCPIGTRLPSLAGALKLFSSRGTNEPDRLGQSRERGALPPAGAASETNKKSLLLPFC